MFSSYFRSKCLFKYIFLIDVLFPFLLVKRGEKGKNRFIRFARAQDVVLVPLFYLLEWIMYMLANGKKMLSVSLQNTLNQNYDIV